MMVFQPKTKKKAPTGYRVMMNYPIKSVFFSVVLKLTLIVCWIDEILFYCYFFNITKFSS